MRERDTIAESAKQTVKQQRAAEHERDLACSLSRWVRIDPVFDSELDELLKWASGQLGSGTQAHPKVMTESFRALQRHEHLMIRLLVSGRARRVAVQSGRDGWLRQREGEVSGACDVHGGDEDGEPAGDGDAGA